MIFLWRTDHMLQQSVLWSTFRHMSVFIFYEEITALARITERLTKPAVAVLSGAKCETKIPIIMKLSGMYDTIFVGGVIANTLLKHRGYNVGTSKVSDMIVPQVVIDNDAIVLPRDVIVANSANTVRMVPVEKIGDDDMIIDIGDQTVETMRDVFMNAKTIIMNGPTGWYERGFTKQTFLIVDMIRKTNAYTFAGGGDIVALLEQTGQVDGLTFVSTGRWIIACLPCKWHPACVRSSQKKYQGCLTAPAVSAHHPPHHHSTPAAPWYGPALWLRDTTLARGR